MRIIIGADGRVAQVLDSPIVRSTPGPFSADFRAAVEVAVKGWTFQPAQRRQLEEGDDYDHDGKPDFQRVVASDPIPVYVDVRFEFEIVAGKGVVSQRRGGSTGTDAPRP